MSTENKKILLVDDEPDVIEILSYNLTNEGYSVFSAPDGAKGIELAKNENPDLIILDVMMPEMDGISACKELRKQEQFSKTLIIMLTARNEDYSQIAGFEAGADDYITKPLKPSVFLSRVKSLFRRIDQQGVKSKAEVGDFVINQDEFLVYKSGNPVSLPKKEFHLMALLTSKPGRVFTREEIMNKVWGAETVVGDRTIDVHIRKLREKFGDEYFKTIKGIGYKFEH